MKEIFSNLKDMISKQKKIVSESKSMINSINNSQDSHTKNMLSSHIESLKDSLKKTNEEIEKNLDSISLTKPLNKKEKPKINLSKEKKISVKKIKMGDDISRLEKQVLKRLRKKEKKVTETKVKKPSKYIQTANKFFSNISRELVKRKEFSGIENDLTRTNLEFTPTSYISIVLFSTSIAGIVSLVIFLFLFFYSSGTLIDNLIRFFWILFAVPIATFIFLYFYPSLERRSAEYQIDQELPFATIHMSAISGSRLEPSKIFSIIISTKEYPYIEKEFTKVINEINVYGSDLVTAMRDVAKKTSSKKLAELLNSLATTINSGGDLPTFFDKRAETLLFDYRLEREKYSKTAETFMDIYISVVIAAPMILMLLLMMIRISGLGIQLSSSSITLIIILGVTLINVIFLSFLQLRQPKG